MKSVSVEIKGISGLLMHSFPMTPIEAIEKKSPQEQAELALYKDPENGSVYVPGVNIQRAIVSAATYSKGKGRGSLAKIAAAGVFVIETRISVKPQKWVIDSRPVVVPATKGRVVRHRPRFDEWSLAFTLEFDETLMTFTQLRKCVDDCGSRVGLLDFRPEKRGPFGRFMVTRWENEG